MLERLSWPPTGHDPVERVVWLYFDLSREFQYGPDSWLSPSNGTYALAVLTLPFTARRQEEQHKLVSLHVRN